jgi:hypothetical protein
MMPPRWQNWSNGWPGSGAGESSAKTRYRDGAVDYAAGDLESGGFGKGWGVSRGWTNVQGELQAGSFLGRGWVMAESPRGDRCNLLSMLAFGAAAFRFES